MPPPGGEGGTTGPMPLPTIDYGQGFQQPAMDAQLLESKILDFNIPAPTAEEEGTAEMVARHYVGVAGIVGLAPRTSPGESWRVLSRRRWSDEVEETIRVRIRDALIAGKPIYRDRAIYEIWRTYEKIIGKGEGRKLFGNPQGAYSVERPR